jgi:hypothetical protein
MTFDEFHEDAFVAVPKGGKEAFRIITEGARA